MLAYKAEREENLDLDLAQAFWRGRVINADTHRVIPNRRINTFDQYINKGSRQLNEIHIKKELEEAHLYKMNAIQHNHRKHLISGYNEKQKKIKELEGLLADLKKEQKPDEFLNSLPPILKTDVRMYSSHDIEYQLNKNECKELNEMSLDEIDNISKVGMLDVYVNSETGNYHTGTERDELVKRYEEVCKKRSETLRENIAKEEKKRLDELKNDMEKLGLKTCNHTVLNIVKSTWSAFTGFFYGSDTPKKIKTPVKSIADPLQPGCDD